MRKYCAAVLCILMSVLLICACSVKSKSSLVSYAKSEFGDCSFVDEIVTGSGNDKVRTVYLTDKDTGIEYKVTSELKSMNIDGSHLGYSEYTSSNFTDLYIEYIADKAKDELANIKKEYGVEISENLGEIDFTSRPEPQKPEEVAKAVRDVVKSYDEKNLLNLTYLVHSENGKAYLGVLKEDGKWKGNDSYAVIDFVHSIYPNAEYRSSIYGLPESYVNYEDMERLRALGCDDHDKSNTEFFFFKDPKKGTIVAFNLEDIGLEGFIITDYRDFNPGDTLYCDALGIH